MQLVIDAPQGQDLQLLLALLERLQISYKPVVSPKKAAKSNGKSEPPEAAPAQTLAEKYAGSLAGLPTESLRQYLIETRNEWERSI